MLTRRTQIGWYGQIPFGASQDLPNWQTVMEQTVSAANMKVEGYKNRIAALEDDLFRARVSRAGIENNVSHVRRNPLDSRVS